ncbi:DUF2255 family protein [Nonomuraea antimicrobica]|uniref:DUF2255 family protein n=1 Tax=Nonomuraea antimicrobica TaxID=561173 RepID=A0ABP7CC78_9ACTN
MGTWTNEELNRIESTAEVAMAPLDDDGSQREPVTIWVVRDGDDVFVRSYRGLDGAWFRAAKVSHEGHLQADGVDKDVTLTEEADPDLNERLDAAYRSKYSRYGAEYVEAIVAEPARATTLKVMPR